jgi:hypothetical protein
MPTEPSSERSTKARQAALARWSRLDESERREATRPGREAFLNKFEDAPNPGAALRLHMSKITTRRK